MNNQKHWWQSKTEWANFLAGIAILVQVLTGEEWLPPEAQVGILAIINIILRKFTSQPVGK